MSAGTHSAKSSWPRRATTGLALLVLLEGLVHHGAFLSLAGLLLLLASLGLSISGLERLRGIRIGASLLGLAMLVLGAYAGAGHLARWLLGWPVVGVGWTLPSKVVIREALGFSLLGLGLVLMGWSRELEEKGVGPQHLSAALFLAGGGISLQIWHVLSAAELLRLQNALEATRIGIQDRLQAELSTLLRSQARLARRNRSWREEARWDLEEQPALGMVARLDENGVPVALMAPEALEVWSGWLQGKLENWSDRAGLGEARAELVSLPGGAPGILLGAGSLGGRAGRQGENAAVGPVVSVVRAGPLVEGLLLGVRERGYGVRVRLGGRSLPIPIPTPVSEGEGLPTERGEIRILGISWEVEVWPSLDLAIRERSRLPEHVLILGLLLSGVLGLATYFAQLSRVRSHEVTLLLENLRSEVEDHRTADLQLKERNQDLETLLFVVSHDLKEPLRAMASFSALLEERYRGDLPEKAVDLLDRIRRAAHRQEQLLDDLTTLSRAQRMDLPGEAVDLGEVVDEVLTLLEERIRESQAVVQVVGPLPKVPTQRTWAVQAVANLVANALKFTREGSPPEVEISGYHGGEGEGCAGLVVADRGTGVPEGQEERIFQLFKRAVGRRIEGTGAGLAIVRQIALRHGGRAWMEPRPGGGSCFFLCLPRVAGGKP